MSDNKYVVVNIAKQTARPLYIRFAAMSYGYCAE